MEMKIIILCGILLVATFLLGMFRLWWLRKCYDKARAEKKNVLEREQKALALKQLDTYYKAKAATWKCIGIAFVVIVILGGAVWGIGRIVQAHKAEKEQAKVEKSDESSGKGLFYYFSYEGNLERYMEHRKEVYNEILFSIQETEEKIQKAKASGDKSEEIIQESLLKKFKNNLNEAKEKTENDLLFNNGWEGKTAVCILGIIVLVLSSLVVAFGGSFSKAMGIILSLIVNLFGGIASIFIEGVSWAVLIFWIVMILNLFLVYKYRKKADWDWED